MLLELIDNCTVVIRSVGERTTELCRYIIEQQVFSKNVFVINEIPFSKAVQKTFTIGLDNNLPWTIAIDADVLTSSKGLRRLVSCAETYQEPFFKGNCRGVDKYFGSVRTICPHIYHTSYFEFAIKAFPQEEFLRPESHILDIVNAHYQLSVAKFSDIIAIHDFEQGYSDIFRKAYIYAKKHPEKIDFFIKYWSSCLGSNIDYLVALSGLYKGLFSEKPVTINANDSTSDLKVAPFLEYLEEKPLINTHKYQKIIAKINATILFASIIYPMSKKMLQKTLPLIHLY